MTEIHGKLRDHLEGKEHPYPKTYTVMLDGRYKRASTRVNLDRLAIQCVEEGLNEHYEGDFVEYTKQKMYDTPIDIYFCKRKSLHSANTYYIQDIPTPVQEFGRQEYVELEPCDMIIPTNIEVFAYVSHACRNNTNMDDLITRTIEKTMRKNFAYCFRKNKSIVPKDTEWKIHQKTNTRVMNIPHSKKLAQEKLKERKEVFRNIFDNFVIHLPHSQQKAYSENRIRYVHNTSKSDRFWQCTQLIKAVGEEKMLEITDDEINEICRDFCMDIVKRMTLHIATVVYKEQV